MPTVSKIDYEKRIDFIIELILAGITQRRFILQNVIEKYGVAESQVDKDLKKAREILRDALDLERADKLADVLNKYNNLYYKNMKIQDYKECRSVLDSLVKLGGLAEPDKVDHTTGGEKINIPPIDWAATSKDGKK
jgi:hypothetical protein